MATERPTTSEIMGIFNNAQNNISEIREEINSWKDAVGKRLSILNSQFYYALSSLDSMRVENAADTGKIMLASVEKRGSYDSYGITVHPKMVKEPRDIFNIRTTTGYIFKNNVSATVNGENSPEILEALKRDSIKEKEFSIRAFTEDTLEIVITPEHGNALGSLSANMIEIEPFLPGSFNLESIELYSRSGGEIPEQVITGVSRVGSERFIFDMKSDISKAVLAVRLLHTDANGKHPFGLKHLYFCEADFRDDSYVIVKIDKPSYINYIYDKVIIRSQFGTDVNADCDEEDIRFYSEYDPETGLGHQLELSSTESPSYIAINTMSCYMRIPLHTSLIAVRPDIRASEA